MAKSIISVVKQCPTIAEDPRIPPSGLPYYFYLTEAGDGTGLINQNGNYSVTPKTIKFEAEHPFYMYALLVNVGDASTFNQGDYGGISGGVTNGIKFFISDGITDTPLLYEAGVKKNYEWLEITPESKLTSWAGGEQTLVVHLNMECLFGTPLFIQTGYTLKCVLNDDFSALINHTFRISGNYFVTY
jgi:hypothetical protein